jgi:hypothetical protein
MVNYIQIINDYEELYSKMGKKLCVGRQHKESPAQKALDGGHPKQPPTQKAFVMEVGISTRQHKGPFLLASCWRVLADRTNCLWRSENSHIIYT